MNDLAHRGRHFSGRCRYSQIIQLLAGLLEVRSVGEAVWAPTFEGRFVPKCFGPHHGVFFVATMRVSYRKGKAARKCPFQAPQQRVPLFIVGQIRKVASPCGEGTSRQRVVLRRDKNSSERARTRERASKKRPNGCVRIYSSVGDESTAHILMS